MDTPLYRHVRHFLETQGLLGRDRAAGYVIAFSGGRDSVALLHTLADLKNDAENGLPNLQLTVAYYWHPWRPVQADLMAVRHHCEALGMQWVVLSPDLTLAKSETAAREDRYKQLSRLAHDLDASAILTAHHLDDQIETILFRLLRGTGIEGLEGILPILTWPIAGLPNTMMRVARPFLDLPRAELETYIQERNLTYLDDPTNTDTRIKRNYVRHELIPRVREAFPNAGQALLRLAELTTGDMEIIDSKISEIWADIYDADEETLDESLFNQLSHPIQRRITRKFLALIGEETGYHKVEEVIGFIAGQSRRIDHSALFSLGPNRFLSAYRGVITVETGKTESLHELTVGIPAEVSHTGLKATLSIKPLNAEERAKPVDFARLPDNVIYADLSKLNLEEITLRSRKQGDRIRPLGMPSEIKLKRFFINRAVPRFERDQVPLLATESEILWAVGIGLSERIRVKDKPTHRISLLAGDPT